MRLGAKAILFAAVPALVAAVANCSGPEPPLLGAPNALQGKEQPRPSTPDDSNKANGICDNGQGAVDGGACKVSFKNDIFKMLISPAWGCSDATSCHGNSIPPKIDKDNLQGTWDALRQRKTAGKSYINPCSTDPASASFECNIQAATPCGSHMPKPPGVQPTAGEITMVHDWLACGSPFN